MLVAFNRFASEGHSRKTQLRRPSRAYARYSNDREFSTRQRARKLPSVLKGNRKRIGKKVAQENAERSDAQAHRRLHRACHAANRCCANGVKATRYHESQRNGDSAEAPHPCGNEGKRERLARREPTGKPCPAATHENDQTLPLPSMYGKNLIFKTGDVDATGLEEPLSLIEQGLIDTSCLISKRYALNDILEAYRAFEAHEDGCLKVVITPWEER